MNYLERCHTLLDAAVDPRSTMRLRGSERTVGPAEGSGEVSNTVLFESYRPEPRKPRYWMFTRDVHAQLMQQTHGRQMSHGMFMDIDVLIVAPWGVPHYSVCELHTEEEPR